MSGAPGTQLQLPAARLFPAPSTEDGVAAAVDGARVFVGIQREELVHIHVRSPLG